MNSKLSKKTMLCWPTSTLSYAVGSVLMGYVTFYATDVMGISAVAAGMIFMISKIFDGVTDVIAGFLIDKTHTRFGKGRPYALGTGRILDCSGTALQRSGHGSDCIDDLSFYHVFTHKRRIPDLVSLFGTGLSGECPG